jgi:hypothetical protein
MTPIRWIENSRKAYAALLNLYPQEHRADYGTAMQQVFTEQCRSAYQQKGAIGIILLWLRTLPDLGYTATMEHVTAPNASAGLMEPVPNAPLPWKGVFLILLPGLVYLVSQIAQLTGQPWYMTVYYRAAFFLIIPVLLVWAITRRFPLWGLIPLGLLYRLAQEIGYQFIALHPDAFSSNPLLNLILSLARLVQQKLWLIILPMTLAILFLAWGYLRQQKVSRSFWIWIGVYLAAVMLQSSDQIQWLVKYTQENLALLTSNNLQKFLNSDVIGYLYSLTWNLYNVIAFLLLIFIGTLFTRRHGFFAILLPVGYILPAILVGTPWNLGDATRPVTTLTIIVIAILIYRSLLSLVIPIWMSRTRSVASKKRIILISIALALGIHAVMQFYLVFFFPDLGYHMYPQWVMSVASDELRMISAIVLGIIMYQSTQPTHQAPDQVPTEYTEFSIKKA